MGNENSSGISPEETEQIENERLRTTTPAQVKELRRRGFSKEGPRKESEASDSQKKLKNVPKGDKFTNLQSNGMRAVDCDSEDSDKDDGDDGYSWGKIGLAAGALAAVGAAGYAVHQATPEERQRRLQILKMTVGAVAAGGAVSYYLNQANETSEEEKKLEKQCL